MNTVPCPASAPARLKFWGVRGSIPTPGPTTIRYGGNTSCVEVRTQGQIIILDAGTGLRPLGQALSSEFDGRPMQLTLLLTHTHWDHIQGLPFFRPLYQPVNRLRILGYEGARRGLDAVLSRQMESSFFPIRWRELPANLLIEELHQMEFELGPIKIQAHTADHPGFCVGYRLDAPEGSIAFFPDNELRAGPLSSTRNRHSSAECGPGATGLEDHSLVDFLREIDVLIMDAQYDRAEYESHKGWGHGCLDEVVALAALVGAKRLFLFHHDPEHDDARITNMVAHARDLVAARHSALRVEAAREGLEVELPLQAC